MERSMSRLGLLLPGNQEMIHIRKGTLADIDGIMYCFETAKRYMRANGNHNQWINGYPSCEHVTADIANGNCYVGVDDEGDIVLVFAFIVGEDPTYAVIEDGQWPNNLPYGTIHRIASLGKHHGMLRRCVDYCSTVIDNLRLDTHADNATMQIAAQKLGFKRCGIIYCADGSPRIAFQKII